MPEDTVRLVALRTAELIHYQDLAYATLYIDELSAVWSRERVIAPGRQELTQAVARYLYKLMAYKDEYEVARLLLKREWKQQVRETFVDPNVRFNFHIPILRERGFRNKLELGGWFRLPLRMLIPLRRLRGTRLDPFGATRVRRTERELISWYRELLAELRLRLTPDNHALAVAIATAPDRIRGYERLKLDGAAKAKDFVRMKMKEFKGPASEVAGPQSV